jgi:hypothetical protein
VAETGKPAGVPESEAVFAIGNLTTPIAGNSNAKTLEAQIKIKPVNFMITTVSSKENPSKPWIAYCANQGETNRSFIVRPGSSRRARIGDLDRISPHVAVPLISIPIVLC